MLKNYLTVAWRHILKNKLYASINILGLMVGLSVFIFGWLLAEYESSHDMFWKNSSRIYTAGTLFTEQAASNVGIREGDAIYTGFTPIIRADSPEIEAVARTKRMEFLVSIGENEYYEDIRFADPELLQIFDLEFIAGDTTSLRDPSSVILNESAAMKFFGRTDVLGEVLVLDHDTSLFVRGVFRDVPANSHFNSSLLTDGSLHMLAPISLLAQMDKFDADEDFGNLSMGDLTYMLIPEDKDAAWLQARMDAVYEAHYNEQERDFIAQLKVRPIREANLILQNAIGMPILDSIRVLAFLVLVVAIVNYTNLATAQSMSRAREVGLRKTMGAGRPQLLIQFLVESLCIVSIATLFALALLELMIPLFNSALDRGMHIDYLQMLPFILVTTIGVGVVSGLYPAYLITRATPIDALADSTSRRAGGGVFRNIMLGLQFTISIFMLAMVLIVYFQNKKVEDASSLYPRTQILTLSRLQLESIQQRMETLRAEFRKVPGVTGVTFSSQLPYQQSSSSFGAGAEKGNEDAAFLLMSVSVDEYFLSTYDIPLLAGRNIGKAVGADTLKEGVLEVNVVANEMLARKLGADNPSDALGRVFWDFPDEREPRAYTIVGVVPDQNFQGFHNQIKPMIYIYNPRNLAFGSIRITGVSMSQALTQVEGVWNELIPDYPIQTEFLDETFNDTFKVYAAMTKALGSFAAVALTLSMIGLFGLAAFMAQTRTREIGIRKVMGASIPQIVRLLVWQFSRPVLWALLVALPLAYFASNTYLNFFAERISMQLGIVVLAGILGILFSWAIVAMHAVRVARANPVLALRYE